VKLALQVVMKNDGDFVDVLPPVTRTILLLLNVLNAAVQRYIL